MVLFVMGERQPNSSAVIRWIWRHGRYLILGSIGAFFLIIGVPAWRQPNPVGSGRMVGDRRKHRSRHLYR